MKSQIVKRCGIAACLMLAVALPGCGNSSSEPVVVTPVAPGAETPGTNSSPDATSGALAAELAPLSEVTVRLIPVWSELSEPLFLTGAGDGSNRVFIVEQGGKILVTHPGKSDTATFLDISSDISTGGERGLLGLAFSPHYAKNGTVYIDYTDTRGDTVIARYSVSSADPDRIDPDSKEVLLQIEQPFANHNGGGIMFGPDGMLWIGMGDGGSGGDPHENGQNPDSLLGKMLRIDVGETLVSTRKGDYTIPTDNPFVDRPEYRPEIWATGLRNPWRFSFDSATGDLWIGDVGQNIWEEINFVPAADLGDGANFGWNVMEGTHPYPSDADPGDTSEFTEPVVEYDHDAGKSVTGGIVYRGSTYPELDGVYLYADFYGRIWGLRLKADETENAPLWAGDALISSFGLDDAGEVYVCDLRGTVFRLQFDLP